MLRKYKGYEIEYLLDGGYRIHKGNKTDWYIYKTLKEVKWAINNNQVELEEGRSNVYREVKLGDERGSIGIFIRVTEDNGRDNEEVYACIQCL